MNAARPRPGIAPAFLAPAAMLLAVTLPHLGSGDWPRADNGRYAAVGLYAWRTGSLWTLHAGPGVPYFNKPPLVPWVHGLALHALGVSGWAARLPGVAAALACVMVTVAITRRLAGERAGLAAGSVLAFTPEFFRRAHDISPDLWQLLFMLLMTWAVVAACDGAEADRRPRIRVLAVLGGVALGAALMCKPFNALLAPIPLLAWLAWTGGIRSASVVGIAVAAGVLVAAPWHASMVAIHGRGFIEQYVGVQVAARAAGALPPGEGGHEPPWFYAAWLARSGWPWIGVAALALAAWARGTRLTERGRAERLALAWILFWFVALTLFPDRRDRYALVLHPAMAILCGVAIARWASAGRRLERAAIGAAGVAVVLGIGLAALPVRLQRSVDPQWPALFEWLDAQRAAGELREDDLWQGAFALERSARLYLRSGVWPRPTRDGLGRFIVDRSFEPPAGAFLLYHRRDGLAPGAGETPGFTSGDLSVTRLEHPPWSPVHAPDPGE